MERRAPPLSRRGLAVRWRWLAGLLLLLVALLSPAASGSAAAPVGLVEAPFPPSAARRAAALGAAGVVWAEATSAPGDEGCESVWLRRDTVGTWPSLLAGAQAAVALPRGGVLPQARPNLVRVALAEDALALSLGGTSALELHDARGRLLWRAATPARLVVRRGGFFVVLAEPEGLSYLGPYATAAEAGALRRQLGLLLERELSVVRYGLVVEHEGRLLFGDPVAPLRLAAPVGFVTYRGVGYRGTLAVEDGAAGLLLVNEVDLEDYLASVVGAEMPPVWPREALRAQAVAARTYLLAHRPPNGSARYDICATERCQVYRGLASEAASTRQAVRDTAGEVLTYQGRLINALYSSNSGGVTEDAEYVFGSGAPYLRSVPSPGDADAAVYRWTRELRADELLAALNVERIGALRGVDVPVRSPSGRAVTLRLSGAYGSVAVAATTARSALGLRSTLFWPSFQPAETVVASAGDVAARQAAQRAGGQRVGLLALERPRSAAEARAQGAAWVYVLPPRLRLDGRGWGHGVGMSQWGARGMALAGADYRAILAHYYPGTALARDYGR